MRAVDSVTISTTEKITYPATVAYRYTVTVKPFLTQSDLSFENGRFRLKPKSGFLTIHSGKRAFSTQFFSTEFSDWGIQSKNSTFSTGSASRKK